MSTGQEPTIIDESVPAEFCLEKLGAASYPDAIGTAHPLPAVLVKRIEVADLVRDVVAATRADQMRSGSPMEKAGCRPGDERVRAGKLSGRALIRCALVVLVARGKPHVWSILREGKAERLLMFGPAGGNRRQRALD